MTAYCAENAERFSTINDWLTTTFSTEQKVVFPYGNQYGWGIGHYKKKKLMCNIFAKLVHLQLWFVMFSMTTRDLTIFVYWNCSSLLGEDSVRGMGE